MRKFIPLLFFFSTTMAMGATPIVMPRDIVFIVPPLAQRHHHHHQRQLPQAQHNRRCSDSNRTKIKIAIISSLTAMVTAVITALLVKSRCA